LKWIKHDTDANQDAKLQNVLLDYGLEGYGLYWYCIELIAGKVDKDNITFELEHDARIIARNVGCTSQKVEEMMRYFVELGLFESSQGTITCLKLARRLDKSMTSNPEMRKLIESVRSHDSIMTKSVKPMQDKIRLDENRKEKKVSGRFKKPTEEDLISYFKEYCSTGKFNISFGEHQRFYDFYESKNWYVGKNKMKDWKAAVRNWLSKHKEQPSKPAQRPKAFGEQ
jgi:hypothetical protein